MLTTRCFISSSPPSRGYSRYTRYHAAPSCRCACATSSAPSSLCAPHPPHLVVSARQHPHPAADARPAHKQPLVLLTVGEGEEEGAGPQAVLPAPLHVVAVPVQDPARPVLPAGLPAPGENVPVLEEVDAVAGALVLREFADIFVAGVGAVRPPELTGALLHLFILEQCCGAVAASCWWSRIAMRLRLRRLQLQHRVDGLLKISSFITIKKCTTFLFTFFCFKNIGFVHSRVGAGTTSKFDPKLELHKNDAAPQNCF
jgi:hypothetical protein